MTGLIRCEECELEAARMAHSVGLGASEWEAFIGRVPQCDGCREVDRVLGRVTLGDGGVRAAHGDDGAAPLSPSVTGTAAPRRSGGGACLSLPGLPTPDPEPERRSDV